MSLDHFVELTDERGQAVLVQRGEIAAVSDAGPNIGDVRSVLVLKGGKVITLQTEFSVAVKRMNEDKR